MARQRYIVPVSPAILLPNNQLWQAPGMETILECTVAAYPRATISWMRLVQRIFAFCRTRLRSIITVQLLSHIKLTQHQMMVTVGSVVSTFVVVVVVAVVVVALQQAPEDDPQKR